MKTFFLCSIGPVQDFIGTARRSRDFWFGSWLLSELAKAIAKKIADERGFESLISPHPSKESDLNPNTGFSAPNKILAVLNDFTKDFGEDIRKAMFNRLEEVRLEAFNQIKGDYDEDLARRQVMDLPEFYWVAVPYGSDDEYSQVRDKAEAYLAARKNTRHFKQMDRESKSIKQMDGKSKPKSSLDGIRESVIPEDAYPKINDDNETRKKKNQGLYRGYHARPGEQLSGVDLLKRLGAAKKELDFPSTSDFAAAPFFSGVDYGDNNHTNEKAIIDHAKKILIDRGWDNKEIIETRSLVYVSRLSEYITDKDDLYLARNELESILEKHAGKARPKGYYALLIADGDNMGGVISNTNGKEEHQQLSERISQFSMNTPKTIKNQFDGACIYAGGEDILAYLPLHTTLECAKKLEDQFNTAMSRFFYTDKQGNKRKSTLSGAIVVAHHLTPLSDVLKLARDAEKEAKQAKDKHTLVIVLDKRSGPEKKVKAKWDKLIERIKKLVEYHREGLVSSGTAYELQQLHHELHNSTIPDKGIINEAVRIINRKRQSGGEKSITSDVKNQFISWLQGVEKVPIDELAQEMIVAKEFADAKDLAKLLIVEGGKE